MRKSIHANGIYHGYNISTEFPIEGLRTSHCHTWYEILFVVQGVGRCIIDGREYPIRPYTLLMMAPFEYQHIELDEDCSVFERHVLFFMPGDLTSDGKKILEAIIKHNNGIGNFYPPNVISAKIISNFSRYDDLYTMPQRQRDIYAQLLVTELLVFMSLTRGDESPRASANLGALVVNYINENLDRNISLDKLSKYFFVSKYYLCRAFKKHNGVSIHEYINRKRIIYAKHMIDSGESASVAAYKVGFGDYSAFYRAYVKIIGSSPTAALPEEPYQKDSEEVEEFEYS